MQVIGFNVLIKQLKQWYKLVSLKWKYQMQIHIQNQHLFQLCGKSSMHVSNIFKWFFKKTLDIFWKFSRIPQNSFDGKDPEEDFESL